MFNMNSLSFLRHLLLLNSISLLFNLLFLKKNISANIFSFLERYIFFLMPWLPINPLLPLLALFLQINSFLHRFLLLRQKHMFAVLFTILCTLLQSLFLTPVLLLFTMFFRNITINFILFLSFLPFPMMLQQKRKNFL